MAKNRLTPSSRICITHERSIVEDPRMVQFGLMDHSINLVEQHIAQQWERGLRTGHCGMQTWILSDHQSSKDIRGKKIGTHTFHF